jgi:hypothetical protein
VGECVPVPDKYNLKIGIPFLFCILIFWNNAEILALCGLFFSPFLKCSYRPFDLIREMRRIMFTGKLNRLDEIQ